MSLLTTFFMILFLSTLAGTYAVAKMYVGEKQKTIKYEKENIELIRKITYYEDNYDFGTEYEDYLNSKKGVDLGVGSVKSNDGVEVKEEEVERETEDNK